MKITIIGAGNMGSAIVRGLVRGSLFKAEDISVADVNENILNVLKKDVPGLNIEWDNYNSVSDADIILLAVKPWLVDNVIDCIKFKMDYEKQILVSIAAGIDIASLNLSLEKHSDEISIPTIFRVIPNTAIAIRKSVNLIATQNASDEQKDLLLRIFNELGTAVLLNESHLSAGTALTSCGIAYLFRYVRAAVQAGVEIGFYPKDAQNMIVETMLGAAELLKTGGENPETEIDKVTTPGGITIKGLNELEANGFSNAIIKGIKASLATCQN
ncbi:MAG: pyrroline-5-carboxylate reductase [Dysgonamonadaceae bacterium]|jgi:pyrroline-5-carboxylate reductase|nr:pyrroline-5-carboxylate reductase [Dysgonamonadaceae bacterium]